MAKPGWLSCAACVYRYDRYHRDYRGEYGSEERIQCWRYPTPVGVAAGHWCGEFSNEEPSVPAFYRERSADQRAAARDSWRDERAERIRLTKVAKKLRRDLRELKATIKQRRQQ